MKKLNSLHDFIAKRKPKIKKSLRLRKQLAPARATNEIRVKCFPHGWGKNTASFPRAL